MIKIAPSILSADFARLGEEIKKVEEAGADWIHVDVMDGRFVPNITIGQPVIKSLRDFTDLPLDVHLMIEDPGKYIPDFAEAGSDIITVHSEAVKDLAGIVDQMKDNRVKAGMSIKPKSPVSFLSPVLADLDMVLVMSVEPGFGGQEFMPEVLPKIKQLRQEFKGDIEVDGGINLNTASSAVRAGANVLVAGSAVFKSSNPQEAVKKLKWVAENEGK